MIATEIPSSTLTNDQEHERREDGRRREGVHA